MSAAMDGFTPLCLDGVKNGSLIIDLKVCLVFVDVRYDLLVLGW
jgi:hypothetical protein